MAQQLRKVWWADVLYVEGLRDYVTLYTRQRKIVTLQLLKTLQQLPANIHHSCIVALDAIGITHKDNVQIGERQLSISGPYSKSFQEAVERYRI
ncbi:LytTR family transcriptional regulator DNA-binding domain-containing protein [Hymenobacter defluvii]|uniref:LytTR family transcriptional regulator DNA-binding domain-containing protein n=1 Tax=Hymenobacter defluvii TaxID=2054411 RepID=A0ABS3TI32_9BACT|nr:LytTR family transcriptional regulator DNA-binding domain-containing protein [Hymenobacter defluvii]MBO3272249.1 LytTR family transcriptional regulator DNA-binding domain-containing protein [Hymenobacter defluvii]